MDAALLQAGGRHCGSCIKIGGRLAKGKIWKAGTDECVGECVSVCQCVCVCVCVCVCIWWVLGRPHHPDWRRTWQPTPVFLPGNPMYRGAWQATVHGVVKRWTCLKQLNTLSTSSRKCRRLEKCYMRVHSRGCLLLKVKKELHSMVSYLATFEKDELFQR